MHTRKRTVRHGPLRKEQPPLERFILVQNCHSQYSVQQHNAPLYMHATDTIIIMHQNTVESPIKDTLGPAISFNVERYVCCPLLGGLEMIINFWDIINCPFQRGCPLLGVSFLEDYIVRRSYAQPSQLISFPQYNYYTYHNNIYYAYHNIYLLRQNTNCSGRCLYIIIILRTKYSKNDD